MTHDFKKGDYVILPDGKTGTIRSIMLCIVEVMINNHIKYVDIRTLKHYEREDRAGEAVAELESLPHDWRSYLNITDIPPITKHWAADNSYEKLMADGCDPAPKTWKDYYPDWEGTDVDDGIEVDILRAAEHGHMTRQNALETLEGIKWCRAANRG